MKDYIKDIKDYIPLNKQEEKDKEIILKLYEKYGDKLLTRECEEAHFSSSSIVIDDEQKSVLFAFHNIYKSWAWLGGHVDGDSDFLNVAIKEAKEESGINEVLPISKEIISIEILPVKEHIKNGKLIKEHVHLNVSYVLTTSKNEILKIKEDENSGVSWLKISELDEYVSEKAMLPIYKKIINRIKK